MTLWKTIVVHPRLHTQDALFQNIFKESKAVKFVEGPSILELKQNHSFQHSSVILPDVEIVGSPPVSQAMA